MKMLLQVLTAAPWDGAVEERIARTHRREFQQALAGDAAGRDRAGRARACSSPPAVPDLIGLRDRRYFDKSGLGRHRGIADVMRYAAMNQIARHARQLRRLHSDPDARTLPPPGKGFFAGSSSRYSDAQLYALAQFIYSMTPPPNPNPFDARAEARRGRVQRDPAARGVTRRRSTPPTSSCRPTGSRRLPITTSATTFSTRASGPIPR